VHYEWDGGFEHPVLMATDANGSWWDEPQISLCLSKTAALGIKQHTGQPVCDKNYQMPTVIA